MNEDTLGFLSAGMKNYKKASEVMGAFFKETQAALQAILKNRRDWDKFKPGEVAKVKSTKYWDDYPLINAQIQGTIDQNSASIEIAVNWYESKSDYPFYSIRFYEGPDLRSKLSSYKKAGSFEADSENTRLIFSPSPEDFNLGRDMNLLMDEFIKVAGW